MDARPRSFAPMAHSSRKQFSSAIGGSMYAAIYRRDCMQSMRDCISVPRWIQRDHIASSPSSWSRIYSPDPMSQWARLPEQPISLSINRLYVVCQATISWYVNFFARAVKLSVELSKMTFSKSIKSVFFVLSKFGCIFLH